MRRKSYPLLIFKKKVQFLHESGSSQVPGRPLFITGNVKSSMLSLSFSDKHFGFLRMFQANQLSLSKGNFCGTETTKWTWNQSWGKPLSSPKLPLSQRWEGRSWSFCLESQSCAGETRGCDTAASPYGAPGGDFLLCFKPGAMVLHSIAPKLALLG